jgi:hypothetical protein
MRRLEAQYAAFGWDWVARRTLLTLLIVQFLLKALVLPAAAAGSGGSHMEATNLWGAVLSNICRSEAPDTSDGRGQSLSPDCCLSSVSFVDAAPPLQGKTYQIAALWCGARPLRLVDPLPLSAAGWRSAWSAQSPPNKA